MGTHWNAHVTTPTGEGSIDTLARWLSSYLPDAGIEYEIVPGQLNPDNVRPLVVDGSYSVYVNATDDDDVVVAKLLIEGCKFAVVREYNAEELEV